MAYRQTKFAPHEWYHCYSRSIDRQTTFDTPQDYERFLQAMYVSNGTKLLQRSALYKPSHSDFFKLTLGAPLVTIGAYCLMPNHFHILLQEVQEGGVSKFMHKVGTSFTMYFNIKRKRVGNVFIKPFRSKHIANDHYLKQVVRYIHLNPAELVEPEWKQGVVQDMRLLKKYIQNYRYSSLPDYQEERRPERVILDDNAVKFLGHPPPTAKLIEEAANYYRNLPSI